MHKNSFKTLTPYIVALVVFLAITFVYFYPVLEGKKLKQHDIKMFKGMSKEIADHREKTGDEALWTNSMFGGMPAWQISVSYQSNLMKYVDKVVTLGLPYPANYVFLYFLGFFILLLVLRVNPWVSMVGAIAFAMSSYFFIILGAGHTSKAHAIGYMAPVLAGIILAFRGKYIWGGLLTAFALALEIYSGHLQITYYLLILVILYGIYQIVEAVNSKNYMHFGKASGILILAAILAVLTHSTNLWATYDYGQDTMRGKPELTKDISNKSSGLDRDYITNWSYGIGETWSFIIPNAKGGGSALIGNRKELQEADAAYRQTISQQGNAYWGDQPGTSGPVYVGVIVAFLFILGLFIVESKFKWVLLSATILSIMLGWGKNFMPLTDFFIDYMPGYAKFRAVTIILSVAELTIPILAFLALNKIFNDPQLLKKQIKLFSYPVNIFYLSFGILGGIIALFYLLPTTFFNFTSTNEALQFGQMMQQNDAAQITLYVNSLENVRIAIFKSDALRSLFFVIAAAALLFFYSKEKISKPIFIGIISLLILTDMFGINKRYLNNEKIGTTYTMWESKRNAQVPFTPSTADNIILQDKNPDFRVLDLTKSTFNDASTSYFHKSIGGYHGAKLQRYQDLIEHNISPEMAAFRNAKSIEELKISLSKSQILNALNTKYLIFSPEASPILNESAFGNAWMVKKHRIVANADEEIAALNTNDLRTTAVIDEKFENKFSANYKADPYATIKLTNYSPNKLEYNFKSSNEEMVVFSEVYYDKGWTAYIDGVESDYFRADYLFRAMTIPAGEHKIEFKFEPRIWVIGEKISLVSSSLIILLLFVFIFFQIRNSKRAKTDS